MSESPIPPEFEETIRKAADVAGPSNKFIFELRRRLKNRAANLERHRFHLPRSWRWVLAAAAILLAAFLITGPRNVVAAMQRLLGYIPNIGLISQEAPLRTLAVPVLVERDGITLTVEEAVLGTDKTVLVYHVENIVQVTYREGEEAPAICSEMASLRLPDGTTLSIISSEGRSWTTGYENRAVFAPVPAEIDQAVLLVPCLEGTTPGSFPENWEAPLQFVPSPEDMVVLPVIEITASAEPAAGTDGGASDAEDVPFSVEGTIEVEDGYILFGSFHSITLPGGLTTSAWPPATLRFTDANGQDVYADYADDFDLPPGDQENTPWAFHVRGKTHAWPLMISLDSMEALLTDSASFEFDTGEDPQVDQQWELNKNVQIDVYNILVLKATRVRTMNAGRPLDGYSFTIRTDPPISNLNINIQSEDLIQPSGGGGGGGEGNFTMDLVYEGEVPSGMLTVVISGVGILVDGPWVVEWTPSAPTSGAAAPSPADEPCLDDESWPNALASVPAGVPAGLTGRLGLLEDTESGSRVWTGRVLDLTGSVVQYGTEGLWPVFSPDGTKLVYSDYAALSILDLATGFSIQLPGTSTDYPGSRWSPDGSQIAFFQTVSNEIFVIDADGSGLEQVTSSPQYELLAGWSSDGTGIILASDGADGLNIRTHDLSSGTEQALFPISSNKANVVVSPDGKWIAFTDRLDAQGNGLFVSHLDGSDRKLIAALNGLALYFPIWSPDGNWLIASLPGGDPGSSQPVQVFIEIDTCRAVPLPDYSGEVYTWGP